MDYYQNSIKHGIFPKLKGGQVLKNYQYVIVENTFKENIDREEAIGDSKSNNMTDFDDKRFDENDFRKQINFFSKEELDKAYKIIKQKIEDINELENCIPF